MNKKTKTVISAILSIYFFFTTGIAYKTFNSTATSYIEVPFSYVLSGEAKGLICIPTQHDIECAIWLASESDPALPIEAGYNSRTLLLTYIPSVRFYLTNAYGITVSSNVKRYIFRSEWEMEHNSIVTANSPGLRDMLPLKNQGYKIAYQSGKAVVYVKDN